MSYTSVNLWRRIRVMKSIFHAMQLVLQRGSASQPQTGAPRSRTPPSQRGSGLQPNAWSCIFKAVTYKETYKDLC